MASAGLPIDDLAAIGKLVGFVFQTVAIEKLIGVVTDPGVKITQPPVTVSGIANPEKFKDVLRAIVYTVVGKSATDVDVVRDLDESAAVQIIASTVSVIVRCKVEETPRQVITVFVAIGLPSRFDGFLVASAPADDPQLRERELVATLDVGRSDVEDTLCAPVVHVLSYVGILMQVRGAHIVLRLDFTILPVVRFTFALGIFRKESFKGWEARQRVQR